MKTPPAYFLDIEFEPATEWPVEVKPLGVWCNGSIQGNGRESERPWSAGSNPAALTKLTNSHNAVAGSIPEQATSCAGREGNGKCVANNATPKAERRSPGRVGGVESQSGQSESTPHNFRTANRLWSGLSKLNKPSGAVRFFGKN